MAASIPESDWKVFRRIHPIVLERFCDRILSEVTRLANDAGKGSHERYLLVFKLLERRDRDIADVFEDFRRSTAIYQLARMHSREMLTEEEFALFSPETQETVMALTEVYGPRKKPRGK
jgi:hypothetical protein